MPKNLEKLPVLYRSGTIETRAEGGKKVHRFSVSSEAPVERWFGIEVLSHEKSAIDRTYLREGLPVMWDDKIGGHNGVHVGIFENDFVEDGKLQGDVRFSGVGEGPTAEARVEENISRQVSIGYRIRKFRFQKGEANVPDTYTATRWVPMEVTILPLGADVSVGPGRAGETEFDVEIERTALADLEEVETMPNVAGGNQVPTSRSAEGAGSPGTAVLETPPAGARQERNLAQEAAEIVEMCNANGLTAKASEWIRAGLTPDQVARQVLAERATRGPAQPASEAIPVSPKDAKRYSYARAMLLSLDRGTNRFDGLEGEVHQELRAKLPEGTKYSGGILVPMRLTPPRPADSRALTSIGATDGQELVWTTPGELIEILRKRAKVLNLGARLLTGLQGPVAFPRQIGAITVYWVPENPGSDTPDSDIDLGQLVLGPKTMQGTTAYSRQLLAQSSIDVEAMIREDLGAGHGLAIDLGAIHGTGAAGQPHGIYVATDVQAAAMTSPTYADIVGMQGKVADANADLGQLAYLSTPLMAAKLKTVPEHATATMAGWIWQGPIGEGTMAGYRAAASGQVSKVLGAGAEHGLIFGNWGDLIIALWNSMELVVDPFTKKKQALVEVTSFQMGDVGIRHGESFCKATGAVIT